MIALARWNFHFNLLWNTVLALNAFVHEWSKWWLLANGWRNYSKDLRRTLKIVLVFRSSVDKATIIPTNSVLWSSASFRLVSVLYRHYVDFLSSLFKFVAFETKKFTNSLRLDEIVVKLANAHAQYCKYSLRNKYDMGEKKWLQNWAQE